MASSPTASMAAPHQLKRAARFLGTAILSAAALITPRAALAQWQSQGTLKVPSYSYNFLASTPTGDLLAATYNVNAQGGANVALPALLVRNPASAAPAVVELCRETFEAQRGYSGIACDPTGKFFVSGDTGNGATSFLRKFLADGTPDRTFGAEGEVRPNKRCLGVETLGNYLFLAVDWGTIQVYDAKNGRLLNTLPKAPGEAYVRDITIDPKSMRLFGVAAGGVVTWGQGAPWKPATYSYREISPSFTKPRSGEGISLDPIKRCLLVTPPGQQQLLEIYGNGQVVKSPVSSAQPNSHLGDNSMSFDGTTLYISDMINRTIHVMRRPQPQSAQFASAAPVAPPINAGAGVAPTNALPPKWFPSYTDIVQQAREAGKPMLVYFRKDDVKPCQDFEASTLRSGAFYSHASRFVCVHEDATQNRLLASRFGVIRLPHVVVLDANGEVKQEFSGTIDQAALIAALDTTR